MFCQNCGKQIPDNSRFCHYCGAALPTVESSSKTQFMGNAAPNEPVWQGTAQQAQSSTGTDGSSMLADMRRKCIRVSGLGLVFNVILALGIATAGGPLLGLVIGVLFFPFLGLPLVRALFGDYQKDVRAFLAENGCAREAEQFYYSTAPMQGIYLGREFVYFKKNLKDVMLRPWDVAWAYHHTMTHLALFIPVGKSHSVVLRTMGGKTYEFPVPKKKVEELLGSIQAFMPGTVVGYNYNLEKAYQENRQAFAARWEEKVPGCMAGHTPR